MTTAANAGNGYKHALNTIQWFASGDGTLDRTKGPSREEIFMAIREAGFPATVARIAPAERPNETVEEFKQLLDETGLLPAPGYYNVPSPVSGVTVADAVDGARKSAANQAQLGLTEMFIASGISKTDRDRFEKPAIGAFFDQGRLDDVTNRIGRCAEAMRAEGIHAALHPHVGTWIETEAEARHVLDSIDPKTLGFGPDTGHLSWAGADVGALFTDYRDRVLAMHLKDIRLDIRDELIAEGKTYGESALRGLWAEPGLGQVDMSKYIAMLGPDFNGWIVVEVDRPTMDPFESAKVSAAWMRNLKRPD